MRYIDLVCPKCGAQTVDHFQRNSEAPLPECVADSTQLIRLYLPTNRGNVIGDEIPGGTLIYNGLCNSDGSPRRFYSKSEIRRAAEQKGLVNRVEHLGTASGDRSKHTSRWI